MPKSIEIAIIDMSGTLVEREIAIVHTIYINIPLSKIKGMTLIMKGAKFANLKVSMMKESMLLFSFFMLTVPTVVV
jgi:hypothetical protein